VQANTTRQTRVSRWDAPCFGSVTFPFLACRAFDRAKPSALHFAMKMAAPRSTLSVHTFQSLGSARQAVCQILPPRLLWTIHSVTTCPISQHPPTNNKMKQTKHTKRKWRRRNNIIISPRISKYEILTPQSCEVPMPKWAWNSALITGQDRLEPPPSALFQRAYLHSVYCSARHHVCLCAVLVS